MICKEDFVTAVLVLAAVFTSFILPNPRQDPNEQHEKPSIFRALKVPSIVMASYRSDFSFHLMLKGRISFSVACSAASLGFIQATLEPHMRDFNLSPLLVGSMFVVSGACYGISAPIWGCICDRKPPKMVAMIGAVSIICGFALMGPLPFLPLTKSIGLIIVSLTLHGRKKCSLT